MTLMGGGGNVGIGAAPGARLDVDGGASDDPLVILDAESDDGSAFINFVGIQHDYDCAASISIGQTWTEVGCVKVQMRGTDYWIPFGTCT